ncbi:MAG: hypothetical protein R3C44_13100 [Chloroflexota bacterium]
MQGFVKRLGILPALLLGAGLLVLGVLALNHITNTMWPFDVSHIELVRATAQQRVDASMLLAAANNEIILAFLASVVVAVTGLMLPVAYFLNKRFDPQYRDGDSPPMLTVTRQALLVGLWVAFCLWLQMNRTLGIAVAALVAGVFILFELLLQIRARASAMQQQHVT